MPVADAGAVAEWRYEGPWDVYNGDGTHPAVDGHWAVIDPDEQLVGFYCTGPEARIPGVEEQTDTVDVGVGLRPDLVGAGNAREFAKALLDPCREAHPEEFVRLRPIVEPTKPATRSVHGLRRLTDSHLPSYRDEDLDLLNAPRGVSERLHDVLLVQVGVRLEDLGSRIAGRNEANDGADRDSCTTGATRV